MICGGRATLGGAQTLRDNSRGVLAYQRRQELESCKTLKSLIASHHMFHVERCYAASPKECRIFPWLSRSGFPVFESSIGTFLAPMPFSLTSSPACRPGDPD